MPQQTSRSRSAVDIRRPRLGFLLRMAYRLHAEAFQTRMRPHAISHPEFLHLYLLRRWGRLSPGEMTNRLDVTKAAGTAVIQSLRQKGLVVSAPNADDQRKVDVDLSGAGRRAIEALLGRADDAAEAALAGFSSAERAQLFAQLSRIIDNLRADSSVSAALKPAAE